MADGAHKGALCTRREAGGLRCTSRMKRKQLCNVQILAAIRALLRNRLPRRGAARPEREVWDLGSWTPARQDLRKLLQLGSRARPRP